MQRFSASRAPTVSSLLRAPPLLNSYRTIIRPTLHARSFATANEEIKTEEGTIPPVEKKKVNTGVVRRIISLAKPETKLMVAGMAGLAVSTAISLITPIGIGKLVDAINLPPDEALQALKTIAWYLSGLFIVGGVAVVGRVSAIQVTGNRIAKRLRTDLFSAIMKQDTAFFDKSKTGELVNRLSTDVTIVSDTLTQTIVGGLRSLAEATGGVILLLFLSIKLTGTALAIFPALGVGGVFYGRYVRKLYKNYMDSLAHTTTLAQEKISSIRTVRQFARENYEIKKYEERVHENYLIGNRVGILRGAFYSSIFTATNFAMLAVLYLGGVDVIAGSLTVGNLTSFLLYSVYVGISFTNLSSIYGDVMKAVGSSERIFELLDTKETIPLNVGKKLDYIEGRIEFNNVWFAYPTRTDTYILQDFSLKVEPGTVVAIVGGSGTGKSTLIALIDRLYDIERGMITIDNVDIKDLQPTWLRENIGVVSQEPVLFDTSIKDNIRYGCDGCTDEQIIESAKKAHAHEFIQGFPDGYETKVGERGVSLSGGQKQRIAIARTILKNPKLLILDEATSSLDANSEFYVQEALQELMKDKTVIVIAHRLSTIKRANVVAVMANGKIAEIGTHDSLRSNENGMYTQLVTRQLLDAIH
jgi:ABC-type multidrug transport system fused ATPase/permease subunit